MAAGEHGPLRNRRFLALWLAQILSQVASNATTFALIVLVGERTRSNLLSSLLILLSVVPAVLFGVLAGLVADRADRRRILVATNALRAIAVAVFLFLTEDVTAAFVTNLLVATVTVFFVPAEAALIPSIVRRKDLLVANSLFTFTYNGAFLVGFVVLAPILLAVAGYETLFVLLAAMFAASALLCLTLPASPRPARTLVPAVAGQAMAETRRGIAEALTFVRSKPTLLWALVYVSVANALIAMAGALAPGYMREVLGIGERAVALLVAPAGLGVIFGIVLLNVLGTRLSRTDAAGVALAVLGGALVALALARPLSGLLRQASSQLGEALPVFVGVLGVVMLVFGVAYAMILVPSMTLLQEELHEDIRGRVFGVLNMLVSTCSFLPLLLAGPIADRWGVAPVFLGAALVVWGTWLGGSRSRAAARAARSA